MNRVRELLKNVLQHLKSHIRYQLFFTYMAVIMSVMLIIGGVIYYFVPSVIEKNFYQYMDKLNNQIIINIANDLYQMEQISFMLNFEDDLKMGLDINSETGKINLDFYGTPAYRYIDNYFLYFIYSFQQIHAAYIYTLNGELIYSRNSNQAVHTKKRVNEEQWFKDSLKKNGSKIIVGRHKNPDVDDDTEVISLCGTVINVTAAQRPMGVIVIEQDVRRIGKIIDNIDMKGSSAAIILDNNNELVYSSDKLLYEKISSDQDFYKNINSKNSSYVMGHGRDKIYANQNLMESIGWKVITCQPYNELMKDVTVIKNTLKVTILICLLATFAVSVFISGRIASKLVKIRKMAGLVEKGNLDIKINVPGSDEVAGLAESFNSMVARMKYMIEKEYNENILRKEAELNLLQAQINPHFLYNTLGSIKSLAIDEGAKKAAEMLQNLSSVFRYNLGKGKDRSIVTIRDELENIKNYLALQQYRFDDRIKVVYEVDEEILDEKILVMTLQPIVENSIIHGFELKQGNGLLQIKGRHTGEYTKIYIIDDGAGIDNEQEKLINAGLQSNPQFISEQDSRRIGIYNVNSRIKYKFGSQYGLKISRNSLKGVTVEIILPGSKE